MKVLRYEAHNVMGVSDIKFDLEGHHLFLVGGKNGQGKTSALTALLMALCGRSGMDYPDVSLKDGEKEGWVKVELDGDEDLHDTGFTVELFMKRKRNSQVVEEFRILDSTGEEAPEPRTLLKRLYQVRAFDPLSFERLDKKAKRELLRDLVGLDFTDQEKQHKKLYDERAGVNRDLTKATAALDGMAFEKGVPVEEVSADDLVAELDFRQAVNAGNRRKRAELAGLNDSVSDCNVEIAEIEMEIKRLTKKLDGKKDDLKVLFRQHADAVKAVESLVDEDENEVREQIKQSGTLNAKVRSNRQYKAKEAELEALEKQAETLTRQMDEIREAEAKALKEASWPIEGLSMDDDGVIYQGLPFEQASRAIRTIASVRIGMALNPKLRLLVCEKGGDLDLDTLDALEKVLEDNDFQMIVEMATRTKEDEDLCAVVISGGAVKSPDVK